MSGFPSHASRREFLRHTALTGAALAASTSGLRRTDANDDTYPVGRWVALSDHLAVYLGTSNIGVLRSGQRAWLIDCGDEAGLSAVAASGIREIETVLFTHHHRDQMHAAYGLAASGTRMLVPEAERACFEDPDAYWNDDGQIWRVYRTFRPHPLSPVEPLPIAATVADNDVLRFGPARVRVLQTPGHTNGSVSYVVDVDGQRVVFCGDCIYGDGQLWDLYSLQRGFSGGGRTIGAYHGFLGDQARLQASLQAILQTQPRQMVPAHGPLIADPAGAVGKLEARLATCYENYVSISALRHYFPELFTDFAGQPGQMPIRPGNPPPDCLRHFGTTWMLVSQSGAALVMDVGSRGQVQRIQQMLERNEIQRVDALWVTHYHFDHTDGIPLFQEQFDCPCITDRRLAAVLEQPRAWRLPCLAAEPIRVDRPMQDGESWEWEEFRLTSYDYPGQTLYHAALLAETDDLRMLFVGDSHTMSGNDDYCAYNRNLLGRDVGFQYCLALLEKLRPTHLFNCHVNDAFHFTPGEIRFMRAKLDERERLFGALVPWDHPNYGTDPSWVRCYPYLQPARPGQSVSWEVVLTNHSALPQRGRCRAIPPQRMGIARTAWQAAEIPPKTEHAIRVSIDIPDELTTGRYVVPVDVQLGQRLLPRFTEALIELQDA